MPEGTIGTSILLNGSNCLTLQQLRYVVTVAEMGTITEAANRLYISQPSLTNAIHELEKEMNLVIFNRTNKESPSRRRR